MLSCWICLLLGWISSFRFFSVVFFAPVSATALGGRARRRGAGGRTWPSARPGNAWMHSHARARFEGKQTACLASRARGTFAQKAPPGQSAGAARPGLGLQEHLDAVVAPMKPGTLMKARPTSGTSAPRKPGTPTKPSAGLGLRLTDKKLALALRRNIGRPLAPAPQ